MANPVNIECPHEQVTKVADNVLSADVFIMQASKIYYQTYRIHGDPAPIIPTDPDDPNGLWMKFEFREGAAFRPTVASDLYVFCVGGIDSVSGRVRVDT